MFIRFVVGAEEEHHRWLTGVVTEARILRDEGKLEPHEVSELNETYEWLNENLPCPPFSTSDWPEDVAAWFKDSAVESIDRMWNIACILKEHGQPVRMLRSENPGRLVYEDKFQVVVEEWKHL